MKHFWPCVGKAKIGLRGGSFFPVSRHGHKNSLLLQKLYFFVLFSKENNLTQKTTASQTNFDSTDMGSEMLAFRVRAIWNNRFWFGSPLFIKRNILDLLQVNWKSYFELFETYLSNPLLDMFPTSNDNMSMFFEKLRRNAHFDFVILSFIQRFFVFKVFEVLFLFIRLGWFLKEWFAFR